MLASFPLPLRVLPGLAHRANNFAKGEYILILGCITFDQKFAGSKSISRN